MPGVNLRLMCNYCGELGEIAADDRLFYVFCKRDGALCCASHSKPTEEAAIISWERLWNDGDAA